MERQIRWFLRNPDYLDRVAERARPYLYHVVEEVERRGLPGDPTGTSPPAAQPTRAGEAENRARRASGRAGPTREASWTENA